MEKKIAFIEWIDAALFGHETKSAADAEQCGLIHGFAVGIIVKETDDCVTLALDYFDGDQQSFRNICAYPKTGIVRLQKFVIVDGIMVMERENT